MSGTTVYAVASGKGGVGKTTTTVNLGTALAGAGRRVAVVDVDLGMANLAGFVSLSPDGATLTDVLAGEAEIPEATYEVADGIAAVPSGTALDEFAAADAAGLGDAVDRLRGEFDYVLLDVGAGVSHESVLPLGVADEVLLVSTPEPASVQDVRKTIDLTDRAGGSVAGLVITRARPDGDVSHEEIASRLDVPLLGSIPEDPTVRDSVYAGTPLVVHDSDAPAAGAYRKLAATLADDGQAGGVAPHEDAAGESSDETPTADDDGESAPEDPEEPASETSVEDAISEVEDDGSGSEESESDGDSDASESVPAVAAAGAGDADPADGTASGAEPAEASAEDLGVSIPDAEGDASTAPPADDPLELEDDAIPFSGDDAEAADGGDGSTGAETGDDADGATADEDGADDDDADDADDDGGFLGGIF